MLHHLGDVEERFEELNRRLSEPTVTQNQKLFRELSKEHRDLEQIVDVIRLLKKAQADLQGNKDILAEESDRDLVEMAKEEIALLESQVEQWSERLKILLLPKDPNDDKNIILEIRSGTGGDEAALFAGELFRMYSRYAESHGWKVEVLSVSHGSQGGFKEVIALIEGDQAYSSFKYESGVHRVQRVPDTETQGRVHTSAVTVAVLPEAEDVEVDIQEKDLRIDVYRAGGPGGQSVNTTDSAVRVTHMPSGLVVSCQDEKSQHKNKAKALKVLRARLLDHMQAEQEAKMAAERKSMVKTGDRSEKIRTYNFPQDRMTDHRIGLTLYNLPKIMQGGLEEAVVSLRTYFQAEALKNGAR
jgi:peptide chain release factor 1